MKGWVGIILIIVGVLCGLFVGIWLCLIGGIVQIIKQIQNPEGVEAIKVAIGIARIVCTGFAGWLSASIFILPGVALIHK